MRNRGLASQDLLIASSYFIFGTFFYILGLFGIRQKEVYNTIEIEKTEAFKEDVRISKKDIEDYLIKSSVFLDSAVNIYHLCQAFKTNRTYLSAEINNQFQMNFRTLINSYRIEEAKKLILQAKELRQAAHFEQIAIDTGFNAYGSFLRVFKAIEGVSPSEYYKKA
jgi:YesN/AraC family two-component response regulator